MENNIKNVIIDNKDSVKTEQDEKKSFENISDKTPSNETLMGTNLDLTEEKNETIQKSMFDTHFEQMMQTIELKDSKEFYYNDVRDLFYLISEYYNPKNIKIQETVLSEIIKSFTEIQSLSKTLSIDDINLKNLTNAISTPIYIENTQGLTISFYDFLTDIRSKYFVGEDSTSITELQQKVRKTFSEEKMPTIEFSKQLQSVYSKYDALKNETSAEQFAKIVFTNLYESGIKTQAVPYLKDKKLENFCNMKSDENLQKIKPEEILRASFLIKSFNSQKEALKDDRVAIKKIRLLEFVMKPYQLLLDIDSVKSSNKWFKQAKINKLKKEYEKSLKEAEFLRLKENRATEQNSPIARTFLDMISKNVNCITNFSTNLHSEKNHNFPEDEVNNFFETLKRQSNHNGYVQIGKNKMYFKLQKQGNNTVFSIGLNKKIPKNPTKVIGVFNPINNLESQEQEAVIKKQQNIIDLNKKTFVAKLEERRKRFGSQQSVNI